MEILKLHNYFITARILTGERKGQIEHIPRITLRCDEEYPFTLRRHQYPIRLAFSMTINKAQGQTIEKVYMYAYEIFEENIFIFYLRLDWI